MMTERKWTPGPWASEHYKGPTNPYGTADIGVWSESLLEISLGEADCEDDAKDHSWICGIWGNITEEKIANAHLIAAAPDMYEALECCLNYIQNTESEFGIEMSCGIQARAVLAKARGEQ